MKNTPRLKALVGLLGVVVFPIIIVAHSARSTGTTTSRIKQEAQTREQSGPLEKFKLITSTGIESFVKDLNENGKLGYRLENSLNYGGEGPTQRYAAVVRLEALNKYEYDWISSPDKKLLEARLNYQAKKGFNFVNAYALTSCSDGTSEEKADPSSPESLIFRLQKGDAFLFERRNGDAEQTRDYRVFMAKVRLGDSAEKTIQSGIDEAAQHRFRPVKILFARYGLLDFRISVLVERNLRDAEAGKIEYRFLKKTSGLPKDMNALASQGFRFISGRRIGMIGVALMAKQASDGTTYTFVDEKKYAKEFDKTIALGNRYAAVMTGDLTCGSTEAENERLVFSQISNGEELEYKIKAIAVTQNGSPDTASLDEFQRLLGGGYHIKDLFYSGGLNVIFEKISKKR